MTIKSQITHLLYIAAFGFVSAGCAVHYYDQESGIEHLYGFGHMLMKTAQGENNQLAIVKGNSVFGFSTGMGQDGAELSAGWSEQRRIEILKPGAAIDLIWPTNNFANVRVGQAFTNKTQIIPSDIPDEDTRK